MKINLIESFCNSYVGFVRVVAEDGSFGWGQLSTYNADITQQILHRQVAPWVLGREVGGAGGRPWLFKRCAGVLGGAGSPPLRGVARLA